MSNIYLDPLDPLDQLMAAQGWEMVRYADDFVILCRSQAEAEQALRLVREWTAQAGLTLHPEKTRVVDATQRGGFDFLGYHFERGYKWPRQKSIQKLKDRVRELTKRTNGQSLSAIITQVNPVLREPIQKFQPPDFIAFSPGGCPLINLILKGLPFVQKIRYLFSAVFKLFKTPPRRYQCFTQYTKPIANLSPICSLNGRNGVLALSRQSYSRRH